MTWECAGERAALCAAAHLAALRVLASVNKRALVNRRSARQKTLYLRPEMYHVTLPVPAETVDELLTQAWAEVEAGLPFADAWPCVKAQLDGRLRALLTQGRPYLPLLASDAVAACLDDRVAV